MITFRIDPTGTELIQLTKLLSENLTHKEIDDLLARSGIEIISYPFNYDEIILKHGNNKPDKLYNNFMVDIKKKKALIGLFYFWNLCIILQSTLITKPGLNQI